MSVKECPRRMCDCNSDQEELIRLTQLRIRFYKILRDTDIKRKETMSLFSTLAFPAAKKYRTVRAQ